MSGAPRRVVVTGMGVVTPIGTTVAEFWAGMPREPGGVGALGGFAAGRSENPDRCPDQGLRPQGAARALQARQDHPARGPLFLVCGGGRRRGHQAGRPGSSLRQRLSRGLHHRLGRRWPADHRDVLPRPFHPEEEGHPSADAVALHRLFRGRPCRHRVRHQGADLCHLQRLLYGRACHRHRHGLHPPRHGRRRHRRRLRGGHKLRRDARLAGHARAVAGGHLSLRQKAQRHRAGRGCRYPGAGIGWSTPSAAAPNRWPN